MPTELAQHIQQIAVIDTHEHMRKEQPYLTEGPRDVLADLFSNYVHADFISAGVDPKAVEQLIDSSNPDIEARWSAVAEAWQVIRFTGYGEAVRTLAQQLYDIDEITPAVLRAAQPQFDAFHQPGQRLHMLRDRAKIDHIQTDDFIWPCVPDESGPDFFLYDLSWRSFVFCDFEASNLVAGLAEETGVTVKDIRLLRQAMEALAAKYAPCAIAMKSQHAYNRTLRWTERDDGDADRALQTVLRDGDRADEAAMLCLGDWCWARGCELAAEYRLPFKIHTGYYAGNDRMPVDFIRSGNMCSLLARYPDTRFVLMHIAYPYSDELIALAKHYGNVWADLCWAWSINPRASAEFVRRFIHAAPISKLFAFGGDTGEPTSAYAYAVQARRWLTKALTAEVAEGDLTEPEAIEIAERILRRNQQACFDIDGTRAVIASRLAAAGT